MPSDSDARSAVADRILSEGGIVNVRVLNEFVNVARRKHPLSWADIRASLALFRVLCGAPHPLTSAAHEAGVVIAERYRYHICDALIAAAADAGCRTLHSGDLAAGQTIRGLRIVDPFV